MIPAATTIPQPAQQKPRDYDDQPKCALCGEPSKTYTCARCNAALEQSGGKL